MRFDRSDPFTPRLLRTLVLGGLTFAVAACAADAPDAPPSTDAAPAYGPVDGTDLPGMDLDRIQVGDAAPDFTLPSFDGDPVTLSDYRGESNVLLVFYRGHW